MEVEHGSFTLLIIGPKGGMGTECQMFVRNLAELPLKTAAEVRIIDNTDQN